ncbi:phosphopantetheine-binding protein (plasmid) [Streptomyces sp. NBC_00190]|uniref:phosphopantetheine-binding protein n=1 Tax=unclassified Streptomyces TaxID=2593676 RepID=UPI002E2D9861|nr:phosphopantetheine-binding protein [Streptomyces sp. NBC_00190]WSZ45642.1 phosphopantetheine-binding protein [Streptomyces sp. NBC_00868]
MTNDRAEVLSDLIGVLGDVLRVDPERIDPEQTFQFLGLDSLLTTEFVAVVSARYGIRVPATDLYDHPTPAAFAREVARAAAAAGATEPGHGRETTAPAPVPVAVPTAVPAGEIVEVLREQLTAILCCDSWALDTAAPFATLGVDSLLGAEFVAVVNRIFGLDERAVVLHEYPNLDALAAYVARRSGARATPPAVRELELLLDALRDGRLSVAEALVLLPRRAQV